MRVIRLGTRGSALARWQSDHVAVRLAAVHPGLRVSVVEISSAGDQITDVPLTQVEGTGFFTATIERALGAGDVDIAVHSYKDLPIDPTPGLTIAAVPERGPVEDVLCARDGLTLGTLPSGGRIGTCSSRRTAQILALRPDLAIESLRGNVPTRIARVTSGELDAVVLARAGVTRLGLDAHVTEVLPAEHVLPAPAQGALAVQCRAEDRDIIEWLGALDDGPTRGAVCAERTLLHALRGGCLVPVGALARLVAGEYRLSAGVFGLDPARAVRIEARGLDPGALGESAASRLLDGGAAEILTAFNRTARIQAPAASSTLMAGEPLRQEGLS
ncbi:MAG: hydroxymethylbilane synthase [Acidobacteriota bacterium]